MAVNILIQETFALAPLTTLQVGGAARFFVEVQNVEEALAALDFAKTRELAVFILGGGSNLLIADRGFDGLIIKIVIRGIEFYARNTDVLVTAGAGENWDDLVRLCVERNLAGVECLSGIPGSVGATPVQNVGAYGQEVSDTIESVRAIDCETNEIRDLTNAECGFAYRRSIFNTTHKNKFIVLQVTFRLRQNGQTKLNYADLKSLFPLNYQPSLSEIREAVLKVRAAKSMVISALDENHRSAGSFFKNPVVKPEKFFAIELLARQLSLISSEQNVPHYPNIDGNIKIPAAWLIEKSGFHKGLARGRAGISTNHTLALVNRGGATADEILKLVEEIQTKVKDVFGVELESEPIWLGFE